MVRRALAALVAGAAVALSLPPWGWWPLAWVGLSLLFLAAGGLSAPGRTLVGAAFGLGMFIPGLWWMGEFHMLGAVLAILGESAFMALALLLTPPGRGRYLAMPGALLLAEALRSRFPFGGVPLAGMALGQLGGPLAESARVGGALAVVGLLAGVGCGLHQLAARRWVGAGAALAAVGAVTALGAMAPDGGGGPPLASALVQGGGRRGFQAVESDADLPFQAHLEASRGITPPLGLVLWPEDVVDVDGPVEASPEGQQVAAIARRSGATMVAGVTQDAGPDQFLNAAVAWSPQGAVVARYEKVKRVPFGEYIPGRAFFDGLVDLSAVPRDAVPGHGSGLLRTPAADLGVTISFEVFFPSRARAATRAGGRLLAVPTNAASYSGTQVPGQEVAAARLRSIESGRDLLQAAPTGYSAHIDNRGRVLARTTLGRSQVLHRSATLRSGRTWYTTAGDLPVFALAGLTLAAGWALHRRSSLAA